MNWFTQSGSIFDMGPRFPLLDNNRQSSIAGLYLAGDVSGTPDIKAAINAGAEVARHLLQQELQCKPPCDVHFLIIGGGPAGVSAALEFEKAGRRSDYLLLEKRQLFHTLRVWARCNPLFYASTGNPNVAGALWWEEPEPLQGVCAGDVLDLWNDQLARYSLRTRLGETVVDIQKTDKFRVVTDKSSFVCDRVILCIGKLVYLHKLEVGADPESKIFYEPPDPEQCRGRDVLIVGGTNEALETAVSFSSQCRVTLAHPNTELTGAEPEIVAAIPAPG